MTPPISDSSNPICQENRPENSPARMSRVGAWLRLIRLPNLLTVPGDPIVGFFLVWMSGASDCNQPWVRLGLACSVSVLLYCAGLLFNDWFDMSDDLRNRPDRPIPSGAAKPFTVALVATLLLLSGLFIAKVISAGAGGVPVYIAVALAVLILLYDGWAKQIPSLGPLVMGACRGGSLLLGASCFGMEGLTFTPVIICAVCLCAFISSVTSVAQNEGSKDDKIRLGLRAYTPSTAAALWVIALLIFMHSEGIMGWMPVTIAMVFLLHAIFVTSNLRKPVSGKVIQKNVGKLILSLMLMQAAICSLWFRNGWEIGDRWKFQTLVYALLAGWLIAKALAKRFYSS